MSTVAPSERQIARAVRRAADARTLDAAEAEALLFARGDALAALMEAAGRVRDAGLEAVGRPGVVTFSPKVFVPLTRLCRDRCHYCTFATTPGRVVAPFMTPDEVLDLTRRGARSGCKEALFTLGDRPERRWPEAAAWLAEAGYTSTLEYVRAMAVRVLEETGLLPHLNPGVMSWEELARLKPVAPSMGMMLETTSRRLFETPGEAHYASPDKDPAVRLRVLEDAGRLNIPFTSGLLVGLGETPAERVDTLHALRRVAREYGGLQEVIVQNFRAKADTAMRSTPDVEIEEFLATVAVARLLLGPAMRVQAPPNLVDLEQCRLLLAAGVDDFGGISPLTPDHVNPERPWPQLDELDAVCRQEGFQLLPRLTAHPGYLAEPWLDPRLRSHVDALADDRGLAAPDVVPVGKPWQEPDGGAGSPSWGSSGRTDLHHTVDTVGRTGDRRGDFDEVYGDWSSVKEHAGRTVRPGALPMLDRDVAGALRAAERDPGGLSFEQAVALMTADGDALDALTVLADDLRRDVVGDEVTYVVNRNINFTNVCYVGCRFCAFAQRRTDADSYTLSLAEVGERAVEAWEAGATEVCMQGGIHPDLPGTAYFDLAAEVKSRVPQMHVHAFSPMEVMNGVARTGLSIRDWLVRARESGVDSLPGTAAEILDDDVRWVLTKGKLPADAWEQVIRTAHEVGLPTTATMMYGHVDHPSHWVAHLQRIAAIQEDTGGFTEFVPLPFVHQNAPIYLAGVARPGPTVRDNRAVHAMARVLLHGRIRNIQCSWVKLGERLCVEVLKGGVNDLGGTLMEETISRMAGSTHGSRRSVAELEQIAATAGRPVRQRTTTYAAAATRHHPHPTRSPG